MKTIRKRFNLRSAVRGGNVIRCKALMPKRREGADVLAVARRPRAVTDEELVFLHAHADGEARRHRIFHSMKPRGGAWIIKVLCDGKWQTAGAMNEKPLTAVSAGADRVALSGASAMYVLGQGADGRWHLERRGESSEIRPVITGRVKQTMSADTGALSLKIIPGRTPSLTVSARAEITSRLEDAYRRLCADASAAGVWVQPVVAAVRVTDKEGRVLHESLPALLAPGGWQCCGTLETEGSVDGDILSAGGFRCEAECYRGVLRFAGGLPSEAACVEVRVAPQTHPCTHGEESACRLVTRSGVQHLAAALPGATHNFGSREGERNRWLAAMAAEMWSGAGEVAARLDAALFADESAEVEISAPLWSMSSGSGGVTVDKSASGSEGNLAALVRGGAMFAAAHSAVCGTHVLWGDIRISAPEPPSPWQIAGGWSDLPDPEGWTAAVTVRMADGNSVTRHFDGTGPLPVSLSPMICFPSGSAVSLSMAVESSAGNVTEASLPLSPASPGSRMACGFAPALGKVALVAVDYDLPPEEDAAAERYPSSLLLCPAGDVFRPVVCAVSGSGAVTALASAAGTRSAWDVSRSRFYAFTAGGIEAVTASAGGKSLGSTLISPCGVDSAEKVAVAPWGVLAVSDSGLLCVRGSSASLLESGVAALRIGWEPTAPALWSADATGNVEVRCFSPSGAVTHRTSLPLPFSPSAMGGDSSALWLCSDSGLHAMDSSAVPAESTDVALSVSADGVLRPAVAALEAGMWSERFKGRVALRRHCGAGAEFAAEVLGLEVDGTLSAPVAARVAAPRALRWVLDINGAVSPDFIMEYAFIDFCCHE